MKKNEKETVDRICQRNGISRYLTGRMRKVRREQHRKRQ